MPFLPSPAIASPPRPAWLTAAKLLALFLLILGAKFCLMRACSTPLPFFDQWNGEGGNLLRPWLHGRLRWADLFAFHVQHRIVLTRLLVLGLFQANGGQWDTQVEMIVAAGIHSLCAVVLGATLIRQLGPAAEDKVLLGLALLFALPFGWENTLSGGFQSQFYFLLLLSALAIRGLATYRPGSAAWWTGVGAAVLSWFSMVSAPLTPLAVAGAVALRMRRGAGRAAPRDPAALRADRLTLGTALGLFVAGLCVNIGVNPVTDLQPRSALAFLDKFLGLLGWPNPTAWAAPLAYAPWLCLLARRLRQPARPTVAAEAFLLPLGAFAVLQAAGIAFARNQYHGLLVSRYMDVLSIGAVANFACLLLFAGEARDARDPRARAWLGATGTVWLALLCFGLTELTARDLAAALPFIRDNNAHEDTNVAAFVAHPDPAVLAHKAPLDFECDKPQLLADLLRDPLVCEALPARARLPLSLTPVQSAGVLRAIIETDPAADAPAAPAVPVPAGWSLEPPPAGQHVSMFRSQTITRCLPYLDWTVTGKVGPLARFGLVGERTGRIVWVLPPAGAAAGAWWPARVRVPSEPFHVEAAVCAGAGALSFLRPREIGWLSVWVAPVLDSAEGLLLAGVALWLAAAFVGEVCSSALRQPVPAPAPDVARPENRVPARRDVPALALTGTGG